jgi:hypothetical protein
MITKEDKGNSIIIIQQTKYQDKILDFINSNKFKIMRNYRTNIFKKEIRKALTKR